MYKFSLSFFYILLLAPLQTYIWQKRIWALLTGLLKVKKQHVFARQLPNTKTYIEFKHPPINVHWTFLVATWIWLWPLTDIPQKGFLRDGDPRMLLLQWGWGSLGFCLVFSDNFFFVTYTCSSLVLTVTHSWYFLYRI